MFTLIKSHIKNCSTVYINQTVSSLMKSSVSDKKQENHKMEATIIKNQKNLIFKNNYFL